MTAPFLSLFQNGISQVSGDNLLTFNQTCNVVADLRGFIGTTGVQVYMRGYTAINDGGQGDFYWNAAGTGPDDAGVTAIVPNGAAVGCWSRVNMVSEQLLGTTTNNNAVAGYLGEYPNSQVLIGAAVSLTNNTAANVTSISLTAGDWDVWGVVAYNPAGGTTTTQAYAGLSGTSATLNGVNTQSATTLWVGSVLGNAPLQPTSIGRWSIAVTTTIYLIAQATFSGSTNSAYGFIASRRAR